MHIMITTRIDYSSNTSMAEPDCTTHAVVSLQTFNAALRFAAVVHKSDRLFMRHIWDTLFLEGVYAESPVCVFLRFGCGCSEAC